MKKLAGVVILYNPDSNTWDNIQTYLPYLEYLILIDNSSHNNSALFSLNAQTIPIEYVYDGQNKGIAIALNIACDKCIQKGFDWLLTMDQDSHFENDIFHTYLQCMSQYPIPQDVGMFGAAYNTVPREKSCHAQKVEYLITSGSVVNLQVWKKIGGFDELLFIDGVDHEYCFRIIKNGYHVIQYGNISFRHQLGKIQAFHSLKDGKKTLRSLHPPLRMYYMIRNHLYLRQKYLPLFADTLKQSKKDIFVRLKNNFLYGKNRWQLIQLCLLAFKDFRQNKMGQKKP